jgi:hypothetical protein
MPSSGDRIAVWPTPIGVRGAVLPHPLVEGVHAGALVVEVGVVAEDHADRRVEDLAGDPVAVLVGEPRVRIEPAGVPVVEAAAEPDVLRLLAGRGDEADREERVLHPRDHVSVADSVLVDDVRGAVAVRRVDVARVGLGVLGDVRVGRVDRVHHRGRTLPPARERRQPDFDRLRRRVEHLERDLTSTSR